MLHLGTLTAGTALSGIPSRRKGFLLAFLSIFKERREYKETERGCRSRGARKQQSAVNGERLVPPSLLYPLVVLFLCVRSLVDKFLAVLVKADAPLDQLLGLQGDGPGEEASILL